MHELILHGQKVKVQVLAFSSTTVPLGQCTVILLLNVDLNGNVQSKEHWGKVMNWNLSSLYKPYISPCDA